jgi:hypothetical protein
MSCKYKNKEKKITYTVNAMAQDVQKDAPVTVTNPLLENDLRNGYGGCLSNGI